MHFCTVIHESFSINAKTFPLIFDAGMVTAILGLLQTIFFSFNRQILLFLQ